MDVCVLVLLLHRFHKEFYVPDTESRKSALSSVVGKFSSKVAKIKKSSPAGEVAFILLTRILCS